jgi:cell division protein FtsW
MNQQSFTKDRNFKIQNFKFQNFNLGSMIPKSFNSGLCLCILTLLGVGLVQVYSSSYIFATESLGDGLYFFKKQFLFALISVIVLILTLKIPFDWVEKWGWVLWGIAGLGVAATYVPGLGVRVGGALRWIQLPFGVRFEPAELLKISFPLLFASLISKQDSSINKLPHWGLLLLITIPLALLLKQPDFGSFAIIVVVALSLLFAFGMRWRYVVSSLLVILPAFYILVMRVPYRRARILAFLNPWEDPEQKGFQAIQSMLSFHSGGFWGVGLGQGQGKLFFLPEAHTDFTLAVLGEEMGFVGFCSILLLYGFIVWRGFQVAFKTEDLFRRSVALGFSLIFAMNVFINSGVVMGLLPTKGLTLPFLSYGGSSLVTLCFMLGLLLNLEAIVDEQGSWKK